MEELKQRRTRKSYIARGRTLTAQTVPAGLGEFDKMEESLRQREECFRLVAQATNDAIWDWDLLSNAFWWSDGLETLFGFPPEEVEPTFKSWITRVNPEDRGRILKNVYAAIDGGSEYWSAEYRFLRRDGSYAHVLNRGSIVRDPDGRPLRMIGGMCDLTTRKKAEERLTEQAALLDAAHEAIYVTDLDDRIIFWNKGAERTFGWSASEALGRSCIELLGLHAVSSREARANLWKKGEWQGETSLRGKDGKERIVDARFTLVQGSQGRPKSILAINADITEKKKLEGQLLRAQRVESIGALAGGIAHDLNNVLAPILMSLAVLQDHVKDAKGRALVETLRSSAERGAGLVKQVLAFARGAEGKRIPLRIGHLLREIQKIIRGTFPKNIEFKLRAPNNLWLVAGDPTQLHQVLMNLCVNARDAMAAGGMLTITAENLELHKKPSAAESSLQPSCYVRITIKDTGIGIPPEIRDKIFEPFFTTKEVGHGTGLGLSTTQMLVKSHGGFIQVGSEPGRGSEFSVFLPANPCAGQAEQMGNSNASLPCGKGELILVVDDEAAVREAVKATLECFGYQVLSAVNGAEAISIYRAHYRDIAVVLTDVAMPVMDGSAATKVMRQLNPEVIIVMSSGHALDDRNQHSPELPQYLLPKPYTAEALLTTLNRALRGRPAALVNHFETS